VEGVGLRLREARRRRGQPDREVGVGVGLDLSFEGTGSLGGKVKEEVRGGPRRMHGRREKRSSQINRTVNVRLGEGVAVGVADCSVLRRLRLGFLPVFSFCPWYIITNIPFDP